MLFVAALAGLALSFSTANAAVVLSDNFDTEHGGGGQANYGALTNFDISGGAIDLWSPLLNKGTVGSGSYIDLDGTAYNGATLTTKSVFDFNAGDLVTLSVDASGNQRRPAWALDDNILAGFIFTGGTQVNDYALGGGFGSVNFGDSFTAATSNSIIAAWNSAWQTYTISFRAGQAGSLKAFIGTDSANNYGPLVDNIRLSIVSAVPEPGTWTMMILGFGGVGAMIRSSRQRQAYALA